MMEFIIKATERQPARVLVDGKEVATIEPGGKATFGIRSVSLGDWKVELRDDGQIRPFSAEITGTDTNGVAVKIRNHLFFYKGAAYLLTGIPAGVRPADHVR